MEICIESRESSRVEPGSTKESLTEDQRIGPQRCICCSRFSDPSDSSRLIRRDRPREGQTRSSAGSERIAALASI